VVEGSWEWATQVLRAGTDVRGVELLVEGNTSTSPEELVGGGRGQLGARNAPPSPEGLGIIDKLRLLWTLGIILQFEYICLYHVTSSSPHLFYYEAKRAVKIL